MYFFFSCPNGLLCLLWQTPWKKHILQLFRTTKQQQFQELTRNYPFRIEWFEGVDHKNPRGSGLIPSQFVLHDQSVVSVVDVGGLIEEETTVFH